MRKRSGMSSWAATNRSVQKSFIRRSWTLVRWSEIFTGVLALEVEIDGSTQWILTTDPEFARRHLADMGATEIGTRNPADLVCEQFGHVALLCTLG